MSFGSCPSGTPFRFIEVGAVGSIATVASPLDLADAELIRRWLEPELQPTTKSEKKPSPKLKQSRLSISYRIHGLILMNVDAEGVRIRQG